MQARSLRASITVTKENLYLMICKITYDAIIKTIEQNMNINKMMLYKSMLLPAEPGKLRLFFQLFELKAYPNLF